MFDEVAFGCDVFGVYVDAEDVCYSAVTGDYVILRCGVFGDCVGADGGCYSAVV